MLKLYYSLKVQISKHLPVKVLRHVFLPALSLVTSRNGCSFLWTFALFGIFGNILRHVFLPALSLVTSSS